MPVLAKVAPEVITPGTLTWLAPLPVRTSIARAGTDISSLPETAAQFSTTSDQELAWLGLGASVSRASWDYLDQQRVALPRWNTLDLLIKPLGFYHLKVRHVMDTTAITLLSMM